MSRNRPLRRWLSIGGTVVVFGLILSVVSFRNSSSDASARLDKEGKEGKAKGPAPAFTLWGGSPQRNLVNLRERGIVTNWNIRGGAAGNVRWSVELGSKAYGGPIVAGGRIFVGTNNEVPRNPAVTADKGIVMCFSEATGDFLWQSIHDKLTIGRVQDWPHEGICSSAVVEGDRLWYVSNRCEVICASTGGLAAGNRGVKDEKYKTKADADIIWRLDMIGQLGVFPHNLATCSPLLVGDTLFVITSNGVDEGHINIPAKKAPSFLAIDKNSGKVKWKSNLPGDKIMHGQWSNPVYAEAGGRAMVIFPGGDGWIYSFNPANGELYWKFDCNPKAAVYRLGPEGDRNDFVCTPVIWENKLYIGVGQDPEHKKSVGHLWCIDITVRPTRADKDVSAYSDPKDKNPKYDARDPRNPGKGMVWHYGGFDTSADAERDYLFGRTLSSCAVHDGVCYAADYDGYFYAFDARTGRKLYEHKLGADTWSSPYLVDGHVYIGNEKGVIHIFKHGRKKQLVRQVRMGTVRTKVRATPVAANGVLYVITENPCRLWALAPPRAGAGGGR